MEAKAIKKLSQKNIKKMIPKMTPNWSQRGSQNGSKISSRRGALGIFTEIPKAPRKIPKAPPPEPLQDRFWRGFGTIWEPFSSVFLTSFYATSTAPAGCTALKSKHSAKDRS